MQNEAKDMKLVRTANRKKRGQGMTEYIIIVGLIAILLVAAVKTFKAKLQETYDGATKKLDADVTLPITKGG